MCIALVEGAHAPCPALCSGHSGKPPNHGAFKHKHSHECFCLNAPRFGVVRNVRSEGRDRVRARPRRARCALCLCLDPCLGSSLKTGRHLLASARQSQQGAPPAEGAERATPSCRGIGRTLPSYQTSHQTVFQKLVCSRLPRMFTHIKGSWHLCKHLCYVSTKVQNTFSKTFLFKGFEI